MLNLKESLRETELSNVAFALVEKFSTHEPLHEQLRKLFSILGQNLKLWTQSDFVYHVFVNSKLVECHRLLADTDTDIETTRRSSYERLTVQIPVPSFSPDSNVDCFAPRELKQTGNEDRNIRELCLLEHSAASDSPIWLSQFDLANSAPLGQFCVVWIGQPKVNAADLRLIQVVLWSLSRIIADLLRHNYAIQESTYLPSYYGDMERQSAILFADIRNSTTLFEIARLGGRDQMLRVEALLQAWLGFASDLISKSGVGQIHRYFGDGFYATFGEHIVDTQACARDYISCLLAIHSARELILSFRKICSAWRNHKDVNQFYIDHNEDTDLDVGIGINYGEIFFTYFGGIPSTNLGASMPSVVPSPGHLEYTAVGDHVSTAQRLEDIAARPSEDVSIKRRGEKYARNQSIANIIVSQTVSRRLTDVLGLDQDAIRQRKGIVNLKGKNIAMPFCELDISDLTNLQISDNLAHVSDSHYYQHLKSPPSVEPFITWLRENMK